MSVVEIPNGLWNENARPNAPVLDTADTNDYEYQQELYEEKGDSSEGSMNSIFDSGMSSLTRIDMYRSWVHPEMFPNERPAMLQNWSDEDLEDYCGIYKTENA